jgi:hypothetical protein
MTDAQTNALIPHEAATKATTIPHEVVSKAATLAAIEVTFREVIVPLAAVIQADILTEIRAALEAVIREILVADTKATPGADIRLIGADFLRTI